jgi:hypothetical protein
MHPRVHCQTHEHVVVHLRSTVQINHTYKTRSMHTHCQFEELAIPLEGSKEMKDRSAAAEVVDQIPIRPVNPGGGMYSHLHVCVCAAYMHVYCNYVCVCSFVGV